MSRRFFKEKKSILKQNYYLGIDWEDFGLTAFDYGKIKKYNKFHKNEFINEHYYLLGLLKELRISCTFFINGRAAYLYPNLVKDINSEGHSISSHGYNHVPRKNLTEKEFLNDSIKSRKLIEDIIQKPVVGYRSPYLSLSRYKYLDGLKILQKAGYKYDSSITLHALEELSYEKKLSYDFEPPIKIFPLFSLKIYKSHFNFAGGTRWRILPSFITSKILESNKTISNSSLYLHPYEFGKFVNPYRIIPRDSNIFNSIYVFLRWNLNRNAIEKSLRELSSRANVNILPINY